MDEKEKKKVQQEAVIPTAAIVPVRDIAAVSRSMLEERHRYSQKGWRRKVSGDVLMAVK